MNTWNRRSACHIIFQQNFGSAEGRLNALLIPDHARTCASDKVAVCDEVLRQCNPVLAHSFLAKVIVEIPHLGRVWAAAADTDACMVRCDCRVELALCEAQSFAAAYLMKEFLEGAQ